MLKSQWIVLVFACFLSMPVQASTSKLLPLTPDTKLADIEQTELYARADDGDKQAQYDLACFYESQDQKEYAAIVRWLKKSAERGHLESQFALGRIYHYGKPGILPDPLAAEFWYQKAIDQGDPEAGRYLETLRKSALYKMESKPTTDDMWDIEWLRNSAWIGDQKSQYELGKLYELGRKVPRDYAKALSWYYQSAQKGNVEAMCATGNLFLSGKGTEVDIDRALLWYEKAALEDYPPAQRKLYEIYMSDKDREPDLAKAYQWLYLSMAYMFPEHENLADYSPELETLEKQLTDDQKLSAMSFVRIFKQQYRHAN